MTIAEILALLGERIYGLWPVRLVADWEQGVRIVFGNIKSTLTSTNGIGGRGVHFFWPFISMIITEDCNIVVVETALQTVSTKDAKEATFSMGVKYRIRDLKLVYAKIHDQEETVLEQVRSTAGLVARSIRWEELPDKFGPTVEAEVKKKMHGWGIEIIEISPINLIDAQAIRLIQEVE